MCHTLLMFVKGTVFFWLPPSSLKKHTLSRSSIGAWPITSLGGVLCGSGHARHCWQEASVSGHIPRVGLLFVLRSVLSCVCEVSPIPVDFFFLQRWIPFVVKPAVLFILFYHGFPAFDTLFFFVSYRFSLVIMVFVNYGGGRYWFFRHESWNGQ